MGQCIVRKDHPQEPGTWSRLWIHKDIHNVLVENSGTRANQGLVLEFPKAEKLHFQPNELVELHLLHSKIEQLWKGPKYLDKLKFIKLNNSLDLIATPDFTGVPNLEKLIFNGCNAINISSGTPQAIYIF
ncbi:hypothetical protein CMV_016774 [Castanea mollissima]|uniref:Uncharacterized protein n=1 Tax=Castanea mollissima TaxID=60419 RepID=A0A8J4R7B1_9ROSI|nr:hypothetical protein CMV_016774 [Castanea mollissima]